MRPLEPGLAFRGYFRNEAAGRDLVRDGCFSTGDLARRDADGFLFFAGRKKDSVRRRGVNISAWEVERVILTYDGIEECALVGVPSEPKTSSTLSLSTRRRVCSTVLGGA